MELDPAGDRVGILDLERGAPLCPQKWASSLGGDPWRSNPNGIPSSSSSRGWAFQPAPRPFFQSLLAFFGVSGAEDQTLASLGDFRASLWQGGPVGLRAKWGGAPFRTECQERGVGEGGRASRWGCRGGGVHSLHEPHRQGGHHQNIRKGLSPTLLRRVFLGLSQLLAWPTGCPFLPFALSHLCEPKGVVAGKVSN